MIARFSNDYTSTLNGNTYVTDNLYVSGESYASQWLRTNTGVATNTIIGNGANAVTIGDNLVVTGNLTVNGSSNISGVSSNPFFCAGRVDGATASPASSIGTVGYTVVRVSGQTQGVWQIVFNSPAPNNDYVITLTNMHFGDRKSVV